MSQISLKPIEDRNTHILQSPLFPLNITPPTKNIQNYLITPSSTGAGFFNLQHLLGAHNKQTHMGSTNQIHKQIIPPGNGATPMSWFIMAPY